MVECQLSSRQASRVTWDYEIFYLNCRARTDLTDLTISAKIGLLCRTEGTQGTNQPGRGCQLTVQYEVKVRIDLFLSCPLCKSSSIIFCLKFISQSQVKVKCLTGTMKKSRFGRPQDKWLTNFYHSNQSVFSMGGWTSLVRGNKIDWNWVVTSKS